MIEATRTNDTISAADVEANAASWFRRRQFWAWSEADQIELDKWLAQSLAHRIAYWRLQGAWEHSGRLAALRPAAPESNAPSGNTLKAAVKIAAMAVVAIVISAAMAAYVLVPREKAYAAGLGQRQTVRLADGSQIELNTNTALRVLDGAPARTVWLDKGEAFFEVRHDIARPFTVIVGEHRVTDLGTKFVIRRDVDNVKIAVVEGRVRLEEQGTTQRPALLSRGDVVVASGHTISMLNRSTRDIANDLGWRHGVVVFRHTTLAEAADEFNRYNNDKLVVTSASVAKLTMNGTFRTSEIRQFTEVAQAVFGLHVENRGHEIVISR